MQNLKSWMVVTAIFAGLGGGLAVVETVTARTALAQPGGPLDDHWRYHDGRWSYWNQADKRWYYTNGDHWYYHDGKAWQLYNFDKNFGRKNFERGAYRAPGPNVEVNLPNHKIYVGP